MPPTRDQQFRSFNSFKPPISTTAQTKKQTVGPAAAAAARRYAARSPSPAVPLPIELQPSHIRPIAYRVLSKKYSLNLKSSGLEVLAEYIGRKFGREWRSKCEQFLNEIGKRWKEQDKGLFVDSDSLPVIIREVELRTASFTAAVASGATTPGDSFFKSFASTDSFDHLDSYMPQEFFHVWDAFVQPRWTYNNLRKHFERASAPSVLPTAKQQTRYLITRYYQLFHRLLRNELFQPPSFHSSNAASWHAITLIKNLLGRHGKSFLILGLLEMGSNGNYWAEDPSGKLELDLTQAVAEHGYYVPGCVLLFEGVYTTTERFKVRAIQHPPNETRSKSREAYGYLDFLNIGSLGSTPDGRFDKVIEARFAAEEKRAHKSRKTSSSIIMLGGDIFLDDLKTYDGMSKIFGLLEEEPPLAIVVPGSFLSFPFHKSSSSTVYRDCFDQLAGLLSQFPVLCACTTFIFIPGANDPWGSTASAGGANIWPQRCVPSIFTGHVSRVLKKAVFASNPCRVCYYSQEIVICRDNLAGRLRRNGIKVALPEQRRNATPVASQMDNSTQNDAGEMEATQSDEPYTDDAPYEEELLDNDERESQVIVKLLVDQGHISPWPSTMRPILCDYEHALTLSPLPTSIMICDSTSSPFAYQYRECNGMNSSSFLSPDRRQINWIDYNTATRESEICSTAY
ncbi:DNA polymerase alpha/epsilon subunit B-domain-containing protein [Limtongia smithiae]|uniref:DNA polymerase alpha/epsilon subunit B-domain-containing protein n=1 Tax=Limtongia smithiae TaxID=1125753 RepID=UPI0034CE438E